MNLSILSLNIFGVPISPYKKERLALLVKKIIEIDPDIILLQEMITKKDFNFVTSSLSKNNYSFYSEKYFGIIKGGLLSAIRKDFIVNYEFQKYKNDIKFGILYIPDKFLKRGFHTLELNIANKTLLIINTHVLCPFFKKASYTKAHESQLGELIEYISGKNINNIVLAGDLNINPESEIISTLKTTCNLKDTLGVNDYTEEINNTIRNYLMNIAKPHQQYRPDYILISKGLGINKTEIAFNEPYNIGSVRTHISDHYGILLDINL